MAELYLKCSCGCEVICIEKDDEYDSYFLSIYTLSNRFSWFQKLRHIWKIIKTGTPYTDQIVLHDIDIKAIKEFLK